MKLTKAEREQINARTKKLGVAATNLKKKFIGIDSVIDKVIKQIKPFYVFPNSLKRPLIVNLWGMTGTGKSSLVEALVSELNLTHQYCRFDMGEYATQDSDWKLKMDLTDKVDKCIDKHIVIALDEFQLGRVIDETGIEKDRPSLRPVWDLIDSGNIYRMSGDSYGIIDTIKQFKKLAEFKVEVKSGIIQPSSVSNFESVFWTNYLRVIDYESLILPNKAGKKPTTDEDDWQDDYPSKESPYDGFANNATHRAYFDKPHFLKYDDFKRLYRSLPEFFDNISDYDLWWKSEGIKVNDLRKWIQELNSAFMDASPMMSVEDYSQSLIFCIGNIDEAYVMTHLVNPDSDPDLLHKFSTQITVTNIKTALSKRFRMEQISRLGNNHIIYPSFSTQNYKDIITLYMGHRKEFFQKSFGLDLEFTDNVKDIIYKEGVFPTQGVRPVLSTISAMIDSYVAEIISEMVISPIDYTWITWDYSGPTDDSNIGNYNIRTSAKNEEVLELNYPVELTLEALRRSDHSDSQVLAAVHEAGHAIVSMVVAKILPEKVFSRTAGTSEGCCQQTQPDIMNKDTYLAVIATGLGGWLAEHKVFKTTYAGSSNDIQTCTEMATQMVRYLGLDNSWVPMHITPLLDNSTICSSPRNVDAEEIAYSIVSEAKTLAMEALDQYEDLFFELAKYLSIYPAIEKEELETMAKPYGLTFRPAEGYHNLSQKFQDVLKERTPLPV